MTKRATEDFGRQTATNGESRGVGGVKLEVIFQMVELPKRFNPGMYQGKKKGKQVVMST